jgi:hypothetical protein
VGIISGIAQRIARFGLDLDLQAGLDDVERVDEGVGYDGACRTGDGQAPGRDFCFGESGHFVVDFSLELSFRVEGCFGTLWMCDLNAIVLRWLRYRCSAEVRVWLWNLMSEMKVNGCDVYARYSMVWYAKDHAVAYYREMHGSI